MLGHLEGESQHCVTVTHVRRLRDKLGPAATYLDTVRGVGYRFVETQA